MTRREEMALAVLEESVRCAWSRDLTRYQVLPGDLLDQILKRGRTRLLNAMRYDGKPRRKATGRKSGAVSSRRPGANTEADFWPEGA